MKELEYYNDMGATILDASIAVHRELGPGLLEAVYEYALKKEFELIGIKVKTQVPIKLFYKGFDSRKCFAIDLLVDDEIIIELKSVDITHPIYKIQTISYLKLSEKYLGYLVNFNVPLLKDGFYRFVNKSKL